MANQRRISIFLDTNVLQATWSVKNDKYVFLHELVAQKDYYNLVKFITDYSLVDDVEICIPDVVVFEMQQHMIECFKSNVQRFNDQQEQNKKLFGTLLEVKAVFNVDKEHYDCHAAKCVSNFVQNSKNLCKVVKHSSGSKLIDNLLFKSIRKQRPFVQTKSTNNSKEYSDAGFKDAVVLETIYDYIGKTGTKGIFISADHDFANSDATIAENDVVKFASIEKAIDALKQYFGISYASLIENKFTTDKYLQDQLLEYVWNYQPNKQYKFTVDNVRLEEDEVYQLDVCIESDTDTFKFKVKYDFVANELVEIVRADEE